MRRHRSIFRFDPSGGPVINTTPLIDVMLVMLVMFIITIPPQSHMVDVDLPIAGPPAPVIDRNRITIDTASIVRWNGTAVDLGELGLLVKAASMRREPATILLEPDARALYLRVDEVIGAIRSNGGEKLGFPGIDRYHDLI